MTVKIIHEFSFYDESEAIKTILNASAYESLLFELDQDLRAKLKYCEEDWITEDADRFLQSLRDKIHESGVFDG